MLAPGAAADTVTFAYLSRKLGTEFAKELTNVHCMTIAPNRKLQPEPRQPSRHVSKVRFGMKKCSKVGSEARRLLALQISVCNFNSQSPTALHQSLLSFREAQA